MTSLDNSPKEDVKGTGNRADDKGETPTAVRAQCTRKPEKWKANERDGRGEQQRQ